MSYQDHSKLPTTAQKAALAGSYGTPSSTNEYVTDDDPRLSGESGAIASVAAVALFGSGRDGSANFDGSSAVTGFSLSSGTYTRTALSDCHFTTITVSNSVIINMAGFRLKAFAATLGNSVRIHNDGYGNTTSVVTAGVGADPHTAATSSTGATFYGGGAGGAGRSTVGTGSVGSAISSQAAYGGVGGKGGRGKWTSTSNGGNGGTKTTDGSAALHYYGDDWEILLGFPYCRNGTAIIQCAGGTGGGSGGVQFSTSGTGIGGSGGGGVLGFSIKALSCGTGCVFSANGGSSTASPTGTNAGIGGTGGGGGGLMVGFIAELNGSNLPSFTVNGGNGGNGYANGASAWGEAGYGGNGGKITIFIGTNNVGGTPTVTANGGTKGTNVDNSGSPPTWASADGASGTAYYREGLE